MSTGFCVFFTGLSGSGKTTLAKALEEYLVQTYRREVSILDGDVIRQHLSAELTFSKEHRDLNVVRIGFVASEIVRHGGIVLCSAIAPYEEARSKAAELVAEYGTFVLTHVCTPLEVCERRDVKGLYKMARGGVIANFTGISDPYEEPIRPTAVLNTSNEDVDRSIEKLVRVLVDIGCLSSPRDNNE